MMPISALPYCTVTGGQTNSNLTSCKVVLEIYVILKKEIFTIVNLNKGQRCW